MNRSLAIAIALTLTAPGLLVSSATRASDRTLPMQFQLRLQGPAETCATSCKTLISAAGAITADSARDFMLFAQGRNLTGATVVLDSDGGSVHGAIALGREIRRLALSTTVGRTVDLAAPSERETARAVLSPRADCESMCAFVLLGGVHRIVPVEARVMVHQIWLGDRRDDPTAANYSAEDLVLVQRDIGRLAQYTADMGGGNDLLDLALRIPPWEPMHSLTRAELQRTRLATEENELPASATVATSSPTTPQVVIPHITDGARATAISERRWGMVDRSGTEMLARRHPLTFEGEDIGSFDLLVSCGNSGGDSFDVSYVERRHNSDRAMLPGKLTAVTLRMGTKEATLKVVSSDRRDDELVSYAAGPVPAGLIGGFAAVGNHSVTIQTTSDRQVTVIRLGNTGAPQNLPRLAASCSKTPGARAELSARKIGGLASAQQ
jgi:hypothetical protein